MGGRATSACATSEGPTRSTPRRSGGSPARCSGAPGSRSRRKGKGGASSGSATGTGQVSARWGPPRGRPRRAARRSSPPTIPGAASRRCTEESSSIPDMTAASSLRLTIVHRDPGTAARRGRLELPHGIVETPAFLPVGTQGNVKAMLPRDLEEASTDMILANTYHLALRPGADVVKEAGGLHASMGWSRPILTDSGGFQVFSLATLRRVDEDGVEFRSHIDGDLLRLTPETSIEIQNALGADIIMAFDECPPADAPREAVEESVRRTSRWAERSRS